MRKKSKALELLSDTSTFRTTFIKSLAFLHIFAIFTLTMFTCAEKRMIVDKRLMVSSEKKSRELLERTHTINNHSPEFFSAAFSVDGIYNKKRITSIGTVMFKKNPRLIRLSFVDAIFKSPIVTLIQDRETVKIHFPIEKTLYIDNINTLDLRNYLNFDIEFSFFYTLTGGQIPLLPGFAIKKELTEVGADASEKERCFLILENRDFFQTLSFKNQIPDKILFINKASRTRIEIYLGRPEIRGESVFFRQIRFVNVQNGDKINFLFKNLDYSNEPSVASITTLKTVDKTRVIHMVPRKR